MESTTNRIGYIMKYYYNASDIIDSITLIGDNIVITQKHNLYLDNGMKVIVDDNHMKNTNLILSLKNGQTLRFKQTMD